MNREGAIELAFVEETSTTDTNCKECESYINELQVNDRFSNLTRVVDSNVNL